MMVCTKVAFSLRHFRFARTQKRVLPNPFRSGALKQIKNGIQKLYCGGGGKANDGVHKSSILPKKFPDLDSYSPFRGKPSTCLPFRSRPSLRAVTEKMEGKPGG